jgi:amidohydrolase
MSELKQAVKQLAADFAQDIVAVRRHLHAHPELSFQEYKTAAFVKEQLQQLGLQPVAMANTGLVALIEGRNPGKKTVALRADMDALPITEQNQVPYKSQHQGVMHACGHDVHTSSLLGTARILSQLRDRFEGTVKLIFQPGEELIPGGASLMIREGVLQDPAPQAIFGQHVFPLLPAGKIGVRPGMYMASADELYLTVKGRGGHGAMPEMNIDPVLISAHILVALQQIVSRHASPKIPTVLSFGKVMADGATNIIPNEVKIEGTFRTMNEVWRAEAHGKMKKMAEQMAEAMGGSCELEIRKGYPYLQNNPELTQRLQQAAVDFLGPDNVVDLDLWMAAEDFSYYTQQVDACFYRLGTRNESRGITSSVHTPTFDVDEDALQTGMGLMAWAALSELSA